MRNVSTHDALAIPPARVTSTLLLIAAAFVVLSIAANFLAYSGFVTNPLLMKVAKHFERFFDLDAEANIPTWFQSGLLLTCAALLAINAALKRKRGDSYALYWAVLSLAFLYLSVDEMVSLHEMASRRLRNLLDISGAFYYAWIIPGAILTTAFGLAYLRFLINLPLRTRFLFSVAGAVYVLGAMGMEALGGMWVVAHGVENFEYKLLTTIEESAEILGVIIFIHANLDYLRSDVQHISLQFDVISEERMRPSGLYSL